MLFIRSCIEGSGRWTLKLLADKLVELEIVPSISRQTVRRVSRNCPAKRFGHLYRMLLKDLVNDLNQYRPWRIEPRAVKRRKKQYDLLNRAREILQKNLILQNTNAINETVKEVG